MKKVRNKKEKNILLSFFIIAGFAVFFLYIAYVLISQQIDIDNDKKILAQLQSQKEEIKLENDEYQRLIDNFDDPEFIERVARERYGYAYPDEKVFIDMSGG